jgi:D-serine deaminase-like pyridoxal phosphate-dependent protein
MTSLAPQLEALSLDTIETPVPLVDLNVMRANIARIASYCRQHHLRWRPHTKTHKSPVVAAEQLAGGAAGLTVATLREAEVMAALTDDLLLAYPQVGEAKLMRLLALDPWPADFVMALDSIAALEGLSGAASASGREVGVVIELDAGMHRVGVQTPQVAVDLALKAASAPGLRYEGVMFYPGHLRESADKLGPGLMQVADLVGQYLEALEKARVPPRIVSGGSTPTVWLSHRIPGLTEVRAGTTVYGDRTTASIGVCDWSDCAYTVLATVVSVAVPGQAVIDAGSKALTREELRAMGGGYGALLDRPEVTLSSLSEEHGLLDLSRTDWRPQVGDRVRVVPNHVCVSVHLHERIYGVENGAIVQQWPVAARGRERA